MTQPVPEAESDENDRLTASDWQRINAAVTKAAAKLNRNDNGSRENGAERAASNSETK